MGRLLAIGGAICTGLAAVAGLAAAVAAARSKALAAGLAVGVGGAHGFLGFKAFDGFRRNGLADVVFDATNFMALGVHGQGKGQTAAAGAAGTDDTVHVVFGLHAIGRAYF